MVTGLATAAAGGTAGAGAGRRRRTKLGRRTSRMSARPQDGVVNKWGQTHDIANLFISDGSQFTTGGAENPTLTIVTLAIRQADYIAKQMTERAI